MFKFKFRLLTEQPTSMMGGGINVCFGKTESDESNNESFHREGWTEPALLGMEGANLNRAGRMPHLHILYYVSVLARAARSVTRYFARSGAKWSLTLILHFGPCVAVCLVTRYNGATNLNTTFRSLRARSVLGRGVAFVVARGATDLSATIRSLRAWSAGASLTTC